jgi:hypothetical protein
VGAGDGTNATLAPFNPTKAHWQPRVLARVSKHIQNQVNARNSIFDRVSMQVNLPAQLRLLDHLHHLCF